MLPLFIDGTSSDAGNILARSGMLESIGYDVGMIYVNTNLETAQKRAKERAEKIGRYVPDNFIKNVYEISEDNKEFFKSKFSFFKEINNNDGELTDDIILDAFKKIQNFYSSPLKNPTGKRTVEKMKINNFNYLVPDILETYQLKNKIINLYK